MPTADYSAYHQPSGTGADGTKFDNFIDAVQATVNGLDKNNLAAAAGILATQLADPGAGKVIGHGSSAAAAVYPPGYEYSYVPKTTTTSVTGTSAASPTDVVTAAAVTFDGSTDVWLEFWAVGISKGTSWISVQFYDGTTGIGGAPAEPSTAGFGMRKRLTPSAAAHTYKVAAWVDAGTGAVSAGDGSAGSSLPCFIRITQA